MFPGTGRWILLASALSAAGCRISEEEALFLSRKAALERRARGLRELLAEAERGSLIPTNRFIAGVDEKVAGDLFRTQLPLEVPLDDRFRVVLDRADMHFQDKFGVVQIGGRISPTKHPSRVLALRVEGGLGDVDFDPAKRSLRIRIAIDQLEVQEAAGLEQVVGRGGIRYLSTRGRKLIEEMLPEVEIPVVLRESIAVSAEKAGPLRFSALEVPLEISIERVLAAGGKLWAVFNAATGPTRGAEGGVEIEVGR